MLKDLKSNSVITLFTIYLRYLLGGAFVFASIVKIKGERFTTADGSAAPVHSWLHFFETMFQSGVYWQFIGLAQLISGFFLMTQRFAVLGAILYFPIILNIFVITISYSFGNTSIITGLMLLGALYLLIWDYKAFLPLFSLREKITVEMNSLEKNSFWLVLGLVLFFTTLFYKLYTYNIIGWFLTCLGEGLIGFILYTYSKKRSKLKWLAK